MNREEFKKEGYRIVDWIDHYFKNLNLYPVKSQVKPGEIIKKLPDSPPRKGEEFNQILKDFENVIIPGITHWQSPSFFAYFNANNSFPSILAEMLTAALGAQCMSWQTSPAATELEEQIMEWLKEMLGLPGSFTGVIQDTASTATLCSILTAREVKSDFKINNQGYNGQKFRIYCSDQAHSSIDKAVRISGIGSDNIRRIKTDEKFSMDTDHLESMIYEDLKLGFTPLAVIAAIGTTSSSAIDPLEKIVQVCKKKKIWLHIDAAYAGTALLLEENRWMIDSISDADSFVFNPHKWMFTNFDCSAYFIKDRDALINTFSILPEYLKTQEGDEVNNYRDWGVQLGRRFRALKLWFVIRSFGVSGLKEKIKCHQTWAQQLEFMINQHPDFEMVTPLSLGVVCFRYKPKNFSEADLNEINSSLLEKLNATGKLYLTHTKLRNVYTIRLVVGQTYQTWDHIHDAWQRIQEMAKSLK